MNLFGKTRKVPFWNGQKRDATDWPSMHTRNQQVLGKEEVKKSGGDTSTCLLNDGALVMKRSSEKRILELEIHYTGRSDQALQTNKKRGPCREDSQPRKTKEELDQNGGGIVACRGTSDVELLRRLGSRKKKHQIFGGESNRQKKFSQSTERVKGRGGGPGGKEKKIGSKKHNLRQK